MILTLGAEGAFVCSAEHHCHVPAFTVERPVDTTGAGDAFTGARGQSAQRQQHRLADGADLIPAIRFGAAAAAISVTRRGAVASFPQRSEVLRLMASAS